MPKTTHPRRRHTPPALRTLLFAAFAAASCAPSIAFSEAPDPPTIVVDTGDFGHLVLPDAEGDPSLVVVNTDDRPLRGRLLVEAEAYDGRTTRFEAEVDAGAGEQQRVAVPAALLREPGIRWLTCRVVDTEGATVIEERLALAVMRPNGPVPEPVGPGTMRFAVAYGAGPDNINPETVQKSSRVGFQTHRNRIAWEKAQKGPDDAINITDHHLRGHTRHEVGGLSTQALLFQTPPWASASGHPRAHPDLDAWAAWVHAAAERLRDRVTYWEVWNEPDIQFYRGTQDEYVDLLRTSYDAIKSADPSAQVMTGGFVSMDSHGGRKKGLVERVITECQDSYDVIAYHTHGPFSKFRTELDEKLFPLMERVLREPKPVYFTETGMDTRFGERFQAETLVKKFSFAWARGAVGFTWFSMHDLHRTTGPRQPGETYGLYTKNRKVPVVTLDGGEERVRAYPKASYVAMNTLSSVLGGAAFVQELALGDEQPAFVFRRGDTHVVVAWNEDRANAAPARLLTTDASRAEVVDLMGLITEVPVAGGRLALPLEAAPTFLVLHGASETPGLAESLAHVDAVEAGADGPTVSARVRLQNPFDEPLSFQLAWEPGGSFRALDPPEALRVEAGGEVEVAGRFHLTGGGSFSLGEVLTNRLAWELPGRGLAGRIELPVRLNALTAAGGGFGRTPALELNRQAQVVNRFEHDPATIDSLWKGPKDLSAGVFLAADAQTLRLRVRVRDDEHHPPADAGFGDGDAVEVLLSDGDDGGPVARFEVGEVEGRAEVSSDPAVAGLAAVVERPDKRHTVYELAIPLHASGLDWTGLRMNVAVHDDDGAAHGRDSALQAVEAAELQLESTKAWPLVVRQAPNSAAGDAAPEAGHPR